MAYAENRYLCRNCRCRAVFDEPKIKINPCPSRYGRYAEKRCPKCGCDDVIDQWALEDSRLNKLYKEYRKDDLRFDPFGILFLEIPVYILAWMAIGFIIRLDGGTLFAGCALIPVISLLYSYGDYLWDYIRFKGRIPHVKDIEGVTPRGCN